MRFHGEAAGYLIPLLDAQDSSFAEARERKLREEEKRRKARETL